MADNGPVRGTMVIRPYGYAIWERIQSALDMRIKLAGAENAYFPLFIPESYLSKEAEHVEGFSPELAVVTYAGGEKLAEPIVVRPTSETVIGEFMAKWIQSYRDLPLLLNQWANVVRWELRPRLFLRSSEFLWQEGHTAHASAEDASAYAMKIHLHVYNDFLEKVLAVPTFLGIKPPSERFAGATNTMTCEGMMRDGKALQMATSHELGQNFARAFDIFYQSEEGQAQLCFTTSWGASTRLVGGLIMAHGDDNGLVLPPEVAPVVVVIVAVRDDEEVLLACRSLGEEMAGEGLRVKVDDGRRGSFGRRVTDWEMKGIPVRVEVGPRDLVQGLVTVVRRDTGEKFPVALGEAGTLVRRLAHDVQGDMYAGAKSFRDERTSDVSSLEEAIAAAQNGFARLSWDLVGESGEARLKAEAMTVRCLQRADGSIPADELEEGLVAIIAKSY
jgi:prolyl-tRNA synthetase